jgi:hypothetical protein
VARRRGRERGDGVGARRGAGGGGHGRVVQVDPMTPMLKPPGTKHLKLIYDILLSNFALKFNAPLHHGGQLVHLPSDAGGQGGRVGGRGSHSLTSELNLRTFGDTSLTVELNLSTFGTHPRVKLGMRGIK